MKEINSLWFRPVLLTLGIVVGLIHLWVGLGSLFTSGPNIPMSYSILMIFGPLSTLPAVIVGIFKPKVEQR